MLIRFHVRRNTRHLAESVSYLMPADDSPPAEVNIDGSLVSRLLAAQFPEWAKGARYNETITIKYGASLFGGFSGEETTRAASDRRAPI